MGEKNNVKGEKNIPGLHRLLLLEGSRLGLGAKKNTQEDGRENKFLA